MLCILCVRPKFDANFENKVIQHIQLINFRLYTVDFSKNTLRSLTFELN